MFSASYHEVLLYAVERVLVVDHALDVVDAVRVLARVGSVARRSLIFSCTGGSLMVSNLDLTTTCFLRLHLSDTR